MLVTCFYRLLTGCNRPSLIKNLAKNLVKNLAKNLVKNLAKNLAKIWSRKLGNVEFEGFNCFYMF